MSKSATPTGVMGRIGDEDGAVAVLASLFLLVALVASAFAIDIGVLVLEQREARKVVDLAALDAVLVLSERSAEFPDVQAGAEQVALASAANNDFVPGEDRSLVTQVGRWDAEAGTFTPGVVAANAVRVTASDTVGFRFVPGSREVTVSAVSSTEDIGGIAIGTGLAELDSSESALLDPLLSGLLGGSLGLTAAHYDGLADLDVAVGALSTSLGVGAGGVDELLATQVSVASLAQAFADANPDELGAAAEALGVLAALSVGPATATFRLGDILDIAASTMTGDAFADAEVSALTLLMAAAQAANQGNAVALDIGAFVPSLTSGQNLASSTLRVGIIEPPQIAIGPARMEGGAWVTVARSAQVRLAADTAVDLDASLLGGLLPTTVELPLYAGAAEGTAALTANRCAEVPADAQMGVDASTGGVTLRVADATDGQLTGGAEPIGPAHLARLQADVLLLGTTDVADVYASSDVTIAAGGAALQFNGPFDWDNVQQTSATADPKALLLANLNVWADVLGVGLEGWVLSAVASTTTTVITPLVQTLTDGLYDSVLSPTLSLLGAELATADVTAWHQECGPRVLVE